MVVAALCSRIDYVGVGAGVAHVCGGDSDHILGLRRLWMVGRRGSAAYGQLVGASALSRRCTYQCTGCAMQSALRLRQ